MTLPVKRHKGPAPKPANDNSNLRDRLRAARVSWRDVIYGAFGWGAAMSLSTQATLWLSMAAVTEHYWLLAAMMFFGAALAWPFSLMTFRFIAFGRSRQAAFAAAFICLTVFTIGITSLTFALIYRNFYAQWHGDPFTKLWLLQLVFTVAAALYQFAVIGLRFYLPVGILFLLAVSFLLARNHKCSNHPKTGIIT